MKARQHKITNASELYAQFTHGTTLRLPNSFPQDADYKFHSFDNLINYLQKNNITDLHIYSQPLSDMLTISHTFDRFINPLNKIIKIKQLTLIIAFDISPEQIKELISNSHLEELTIVKEEKFSHTEIDNNYLTKDFAHAIADGLQINSHLKNLILPKIKFNEADLSTISNAISENVDSAIENVEFISALELQSRNLPHYSSLPSNDPINIKMQRAIKDKKEFIIAYREIVETHKKNYNPILLAYPSAKPISLLQMKAIFKYLSRNNKITIFEFGINNISHLSALNYFFLEMGNTPHLKQLNLFFLNHNNQNTSVLSSAFISALKSLLPLKPTLKIIIAPSQLKMSLPSQDQSALLQIVTDNPTITNLFLDSRLDFDSNKIINAGPVMNINNPINMVSNLNLFIKELGDTPLSNELKPILLDQNNRHNPQQMYAAIGIVETKHMPDHADSRLLHYQTYLEEQIKLKTLNTTLDVGLRPDNKTFTVSAHNKISLSSPENINDLFIYLNELHPEVETLIIDNVDVVAIDGFVKILTAREADNSFKTRIHSLELKFYNPEKIQPFIPVLSAVTPIQTLTIKAIINIQMAWNIANALISNATLKTVDVTDNNISDEIAAAFNQLLKVNKTITNMHWDRNTEHSGQAQALDEIDLRTQFNKTLATSARENYQNAISFNQFIFNPYVVFKNEKIQLHFTGLTTVIREWINALIAYLAIRPEITDLIFDINSHVTINWTKLAAELAKENGNNIDYLKVNFQSEKNEILKDKLIDDFIQQASQFTSLSTIDLSENNMGDDVAIKMAAQWNSLTTPCLDLSNNHIGQPGASALCELIQTNEKLSEVDLNENPIRRDNASEDEKELVDEIKNRLKQNELILQHTIKRARDGNKRKINVRKIFDPAQSLEMLKAFDNIFNTYFQNNNDLLGLCNNLIPFNNKFVFEKNSIDISSESRKLILLLTYDPIITSLKEKNVLTDLNFLPTDKYIITIDPIVHECCRFQLTEFVIDKISCEKNYILHTANAILKYKNYQPTTLKVSHCFLSDNDIAGINKLITEKTSFTQLILDCKLSNKQFQSVVITLATNANITDVTFGVLTAQDEEFILNALLMKNPRITTLNYRIKNDAPKNPSIEKKLKYNRLLQQHNEKGSLFNALFKILEQHHLASTPKHLLTLPPHWTTISNLHVDVIYFYLESHPNITKLQLDINLVSVPSYLFQQLADTLYLQEIALIPANALTNAEKNISKKLTAYNFAAHIITMLNTRPKLIIYIGHAISNIEITSYFLQEVIRDIHLTRLHFPDSYYTMINNISAYIKLNTLIHDYLSADNLQNTDVAAYDLKTILTNPANRSEFSSKNLVNAMADFETKYPNHKISKSFDFTSCKEALLKYNTHPILSKPKPSKEYAFKHRNLIAFGNITLEESSMPTLPDDGLNYAFKKPRYQEMRFNNMAFNAELFTDYLSANKDTGIPTTNICILQFNYNLFVEDENRKTILTQISTLVPDLFGIEELTFTLTNNDQSVALAIIENAKKLPSLRVFKMHDIQLNAQAATALEQLLIAKPALVVDCDLAAEVDVKLANRIKARIKQNKRYANDITNVITKNLLVIQRALKHATQKNDAENIFALRQVQSILVTAEKDIQKNPVTAAKKIDAALNATFKTAPKLLSDYLNNDNNPIHFQFKLADLFPVSKLDVRKYHHTKNEELTLSQLTYSDLKPIANYLQNHSKKINNIKLYQIEFDRNFLPALVDLLVKYLPELAQFKISFKISKYMLTTRACIHNYEDIESLVKLLQNSKLESLHIPFDLADYEVKMLLEAVPPTLRSLKLGTISSFAQIYLEKILETNTTLITADYTLPPFDNQRNPIIRQKLAENNVLFRYPTCEKQFDECRSKKSSDLFKINATDYYNAYNTHLELDVLMLYLKKHSNISSLHLIAKDSYVIYKSIHLPGFFTQLQATSISQLNISTPMPVAEWQDFFENDLGSNDKLEELTISAQPIGSLAKPLATALSKNKTLESLIILENSTPFSDADKQQIADAIINNPDSQLENISFGPKPSESDKALSARVKESTNFKQQVKFQYSCLNGPLTYFEKTQALSYRYPTLRASDSPNQPLAIRAQCEALTQFVKQKEVKSICVAVDNILTTTKPNYQEAFLAFIAAANASMQTPLKIYFWFGDKHDILLCTDLIKKQFQKITNTELYYAKNNEKNNEITSESDIQQLLEALIDAVKSNVYLLSLTGLEHIHTKDDIKTQRIISAYLALNQLLATENNNNSSPLAAEFKAIFSNIDMRHHPEQMFTALVELEKRDSVNFYQYWGDIDKTVLDIISTILADAQLTALTKADTLAFENTFVRINDVALFDFINRHREIKKISLPYPRLEFVLSDPTSDSIYPTTDVFDEFIEEIEKNKSIEELIISDQPSKTFNSQTFAEKLVTMINTSSSLLRITGFNGFSPEQQVIIDDKFAANRLLKQAAEQQLKVNQCHQEINNLKKNKIFANAFADLEKHHAQATDKEVLSLPKDWKIVSNEHINAIYLYLETHENINIIHCDMNTMKEPAFFFTTFTQTTYLKNITLISAPEKSTRIAQVDSLTSIAAFISKRSDIRIHLQQVSTPTEELILLKAVCLSPNCSSPIDLHLAYSSPIADDILFVVEMKLLIYIHQGLEKVATLLALDEKSFTEFCQQLHDFFSQRHADQAEISPTQLRDFEYFFANYPLLQLPELSIYKDALLEKINTTRFKALQKCVAATNDTMIFGNQIPNQSGAITELSDDDLIDIINFCKLNLYIQVLDFNNVKFNAVLLAKLLAEKRADGLLVTNVCSLHVVCNDWMNQEKRIITLTNVVNAIPHLSTIQQLNIQTDKDTDVEVVSGVLLLENAAKNPILRILTINTELNHNRLLELQKLLIANPLLEVKYTIAESTAASSASADLIDEVATLVAQNIKNAQHPVNIISQSLAAIEDAMKMAQQKNSVDAELILMNIQPILWKLRNNLKSSQLIISQEFFSNLEAIKVALTSAPVWLHDFLLSLKDINHTIINALPLLLENNNKLKNLEISNVKMSEDTKQQIAAALIKNIGNNPNCCFENLSFGPKPSKVEQHIVERINNALVLKNQKNAATILASHQLDPELSINGLMFTDKHFTLEEMQALIKRINTEQIQKLTFINCVFAANYNEYHDDVLYCLIKFLRIDPNTVTHLALVNTSDNYHFINRNYAHRSFKYLLQTGQLQELTLLFKITAHELYEMLHGEHIRRHEEGGLKLLILGAISKELEDALADGLDRYDNTFQIQYTVQDKNGALISPNPEVEKTLENNRAVRAKRKLEKNNPSPAVTEPEVKEPTVKEPEIRKPEVKEPTMEKPEEQKPEAKEPDVNVNNIEVAKNPVPIPELAVDLKTQKEDFDNIMSLTAIAEDIKWTHGEKALFDELNNFELDRFDQENYLSKFLDESSPQQHVLKNSFTPDESKIIIEKMKEAVASLKNGTPVSSKSVCTAQDWRKLRHVSSVSMFATISNSLLVLPQDSGNTPVSKLPTYEVEV